MEFHPIKSEKETIKDLYYNLNTKSEANQIISNKPSIINQQSVIQNINDSFSFGNNNNNQSEFTANYFDMFMRVPFFGDYDSLSFPQINNPFIQKIPIKTLRDEQYIYVNSKQYFRILRRREKRKKLGLLVDKSDKDNKRYHHESRHQHAMKRKRGKGGRFLSKNEKEEDTK